MRLGILAAAVALGVTTGCAVDTTPPGPPSTPEDAALAVVALAGAGALDPDHPRLAEVFGDVDDRRMSALQDALAALGPASHPRTASVEPLEGLGRIHVDLHVRWYDEGDATLSVQVESLSGGALQVRWFQGPGVEWPPPPASRDGGVSTSAPPDGE